MARDFETYTFFDNCFIFNFCRLVNTSS